MKFDDETREELKFPCIEIRPAVSVDGKRARVNSTSFGDGLERVIEPTDRATLSEMDKRALYEVHGILEVDSPSGKERIRNDLFIGYIGEVDLKELLPGVYDSEFS